MKFLSQINVNTEYILPFVDGTNGQVLTTDGNGAVYWGSVSAGSTNLNALTDVELTSPSTGQILRYEMPQGGTVPIWRNVTPGYLDATSSINALGDVTITSAVAGQILQFNGTFWINTTLSTVEYVSKVQHTVKAAVAITKGQAVYVTSADGTNMIVGLASNASEATSSKVIGLAASNAAINGQIFVVTEGLLAGLDTSTATAGDPVWLGTNGNLIFGLLNKPASPAHLVYIGVVTRAQQNNGEIFVNVQNGIEIDEIHDVQISSPATGQLLRRDSDGYWKNWTPNFLTSFTETDPTVPSHVKSITATNISNWNAGYNDSIRAVAFSTTTGVVTLTQQDGGTLTVDLDGRYLESFTETDTLATVTARGDNTTTSLYLAGGSAEVPALHIRSGGSSWSEGIAIHPSTNNGYALTFHRTRSAYTDQTNTWAIGNLGDSGYSNYFGLLRKGLTGGIADRPADAIFTVSPTGTFKFGFNPYVGTNLIWHAGNDGSGSGLDADLIDGIDSSSILWGNAKGTNDSVTTDADGLDKTGFYTSSAFVTRPEGVSNWMYIQHIKLYNDNPQYQKQIGYDTYDDRMWVRTKNANSWTSWKEIVTSDNIGSYALTSLPAHNHDDRYYTETESDARFYLATNPSGYITSSGNTSGYSGSLSADDNRTISPSEIGVNQLKFGFTSWSNNNSAPWADFLHLRSYGDHTGGSDNLIMFKKSGIGMRIWQQTFGSSTAYSSYADVWTTDNFSSTDVSNWNAAYNDKVNSASFNTTNGVLTLTQQDGGTVTVDLDGRYLTSDTDAQTLTWNGVSKTLGITNGNDVILSELATEDYVLSQGFVTSVANLAIQTIGGDSGAFNLDTVSGQHGFVRFSTGTWGGTNPYPGNYSHVLSMNQSTANGNRTVQMYMGDVPGALFWRMNQGGTLHPWERIWTAANDGADSGLNADLLDGNHASAFALASHNHDDRYYTESESDSRFVNASGDTMDGSLELGADAVIKKRITATGFNPVKTTSGVLAAMSDNSSGSTYYVIETNVPQDEYQMGGFTIELFGRYGDTNHKTKIDLGGYWNPESNGGFTGFEAHGTNPQYKPTIEVVRNNIGNTAFIIYGVSWSYPIIVARDLWLGYNNTNGGAYGEGWSITGTNDVSSYTNKDTVIWRNAYSDSNPAGYITGYTETDTLASVTARGNATNASIIVQGGQGAAETTDGFGLVIRGNYTNGQYNHRLSKFDKSGGVPLYVQSTSGTANVWSNSARFGTYTGNGYEFEVYGSAKTNGDFASTGQINASGGNSSQWNTAYGWGNHADAPYWNVSLTNAVQVEAQEVIFAGNVTIQGTLTESSSIRLKENITPLDPALDKVNQLEAVSYNKIGVDNREIGLIAEEVAELFPEVVTYNEEGQPQGIQYQRLSVILLKAVQELTERVNKLENK